MTVNDRKMKRIRALLDQAEGEAEEGHVKAAENFRNKAFELMAAHGIEEAMLAHKEHKNEKPVVRTIHYVTPYAKAKGVLLGNIATALGAKAVRFTGGANKSTLVGFESDLDQVDMLFTSLLLQVFSEMAKADVPYYEDTRSFRTSYLSAFTVEVYIRLQAARQRAQSDHEESTGQSTALVLVDRSHDVDRAYTQEFAGRKIRTGGRTTVNSGAGWKAGTAAGQRADIGGGRVGGSRKAIR